MSRAFSFSRLLPAALLLIASPGWGATAPTLDSAAQQQTIDDLRNVGTAMFKWFVEVQAPKVAKSDTSEPSPGDGDPVDFASAPAISRSELEKILVPKYISAIPEKDGWGHPYEFRLDTQDPNARHVMGIRSLGRDGKAAGTVYAIGGFSPSDEDQDLPWMDGYFVRWPQR